jgi:hypothetical protein
MTYDWKSEYVGKRVLPGLGLCGVKHMIYTASLIVGLNEEGYRYRYCYPTLFDALEALRVWDGTGDPPGPWIKLKGHPDGERLGPGALQPQRSV